MQISLDKLICDEPIAVHIPTEAHGEAFLDAMRSQFPTYVELWDRAYFVESRRQNGGNYYYPRLHMSDGYMTHGSQSTYEEMNIKMIEFDELYVCQEEFVTESSEFGIEFLFD